MERARLGSVSRLLPPDDFPIAIVYSGSLMRSWTSTRALAGIMLAFLLCASLAACTRPPAAASGPTSRPFADPRRDLSQDEAAGGHTLRKHVGRSDEELRERLRRERDISAASTWSDRASAETAIGAAIADQNAKISRWLERDRHSNLVLDYDGDSAHPFGRTLRRGENQVEPCSQAVIVLKWDGPNSYHVLTAYPECRA
jgi:Bacterial CdiA-CT RNAse A domain